MASTTSHVARNGHGERPRHAPLIGHGARVAPAPSRSTLSADTLARIADEVAEGAESQIAASTRPSTE